MTKKIILYKSEITRLHTKTVVLYSVGLPAISIQVTTHKYIDGRLFEAGTYTGGFGGSTPPLRNK